MVEHFRRILGRLSLVVGMLLALAPARTALAGPQNWLNPGGPVARMQLSLFMLTTWIMVGVFVVVTGALIYAIVRFRAKDPEVGAGAAATANEAAAAKEEDLPPQIEGDNRLEAIWTIIPFILLIVMAIPTVRINFAMAADPEGEPINVRVTGHQWWWEFEYMDEGIVTGNELRIPVDRPVMLHIESADVIHKFWVPRLAGKLDAIPGRTNEKWIIADEPDVYWGQCAEMCGTHHANMRMRVVALPEDEYDEWVDNFGQGPVVDSPEMLAVVERGKEVFQTRGCFACHAIDNTDFAGTVGPNLTDIGGRLTLAAGMMENTPENMAAWIGDPQGIKPGSGMTRMPVTADEMDDLVTYLLSLK